MVEAQHPGESLESNQPWRRPKLASEDNEDRLIVVGPWGELTLIGGKQRQEALLERSVDQILALSPVVMA